MAGFNSTPSNMNFLSPVGFKFEIPKAPIINYFLTIQLMNFFIVVAFM